MAGKPFGTLDDIGDYVEGVRVLAPLVDYLTVNISSPNTPGLRDLQRKSTVTRLINRLIDARAKANLRNPPPLLLKIAPDLSHDERIDLAEAALSTGIDGLIVSNTTVARPSTLKSPVAHEPGGLSGVVLDQVRPKRHGCGFGRNRPDSGPQWYGNAREDEQTFQAKKARQSAEPSPSIHFAADVTSVARAWPRSCFPGSAEASQVWPDPAR